VSHEGDGSARSIDRIVGYRVGHEGRSLELHVAWTGGAVGWHHPQTFTWGAPNHRTMLQYVAANRAGINAELAQQAGPPAGGWTVDEAGYLRATADGSRGSGAAAGSSRAAGQGAAAPDSASAGLVDVVSVDAFRISVRISVDVFSATELELHAVWSNGTSRWVSYGLLWTDHAALVKAAYLRQHRDEINRELFNRGIAWYLRDRGGMKTPLLSRLDRLMLHPGRGLGAAAAAAPC
jgi:hypothetical protein